MPKTRVHTVRRRMQGSHWGHSFGSVVALLLGGTILLTSCGGGSSNSPPQNATLAGNWQFTMAVPDPNYPVGTQYGLQGGFLTQNNGSVTGQVIYSISGPEQNNSAQYNICDSGAAQITGTVNGQTINLTAAAATQTFTLQGTLGSDGSITSATFTTPGGSATGFQSCGLATPTGGLSWSAQSVPPLTGTVTGSFHSSIDTGAQVHTVSGTLSQGNNNGASNATVTGTLSFIDPSTGLNDYPCISGGAVSVNGQISGDTVLLQLIGTNGNNLGQIGVPASEAGLNGFAPVTFQPSAPTGAYILQAETLPSVPPTPGYGYAVNSCSDFGYVCLGLNNTTACQQPLTLKPFSVSFVPQLLVPCGAPNCSPIIQGTPTSQVVTLTNTQPSSAAPLTGLTIGFSPGPSDFSSIPNFAESDNCADFLSSSTAGQSCQITITFSPQQSCTWQPGSGASPPASPTPGATPPWQCPQVWKVPLQVITAQDANEFAIPISGTGMSYLEPSTGQLDFGAEGIGESSVPQQVTLTNQSPYPVQIFGPRNTSAYPCMSHTNGGTASSLDLPLTLTDYEEGTVPGLQVAASGGGAIITVFAGVSVSYYCDQDPNSGLPEFPISADTCTGATLAPQTSCNFQITFVPQAGTYKQTFLDYYLQLNTLTCTSTQTTDCEIDGGRFPVELFANAPSPLRMLPAAGLNFGPLSVGTSSVPQTITLFNDPNDPAYPGSPAVNFSGKILASGNYSETDDCPASLSAGSTCTLTVTFTPKSTGFNGGQLSIVYTLSTTGTSGSNEQYVNLRGTGQ